MGRTMVIGDIHGCYDELTMLLEEARFSQDDKVVAVGDLTVKGRRVARFEPLLVILAFRP
jgi:serine/threonine protein phosphatase 1